MHIVEQGSGVPLVLIPGVQGRWEYLEPAVEALSQWCRVITFSLCDEPSAMDQHGAAHTITDYVAQVERVFDHCGLQRAIVCGVSFGGLIAIRFAAAHPGRVESLVLVSTPGPRWHLRPRHEIYVRWPYVFGPLFLLESPWRMRREIASAFPRWGDRLRFAAWQARTFLGAPLSAVRMARRARMIRTAGALESCARVTAPTLVVTGEPALDYVVSATASADYVSVIPGARGAILERTGHVGTITHPDEFSALIRRFVDDVHGTRPGQSEVA